MIATALATAGFLAAGFLYYQNSQVPRLGVKEGKLKPLSSKPNCISTQAKDPAKKIEPIPFKESLEQTHEAVLQACRSIPGAQIITEEKDYIRVVFSTPVCRFKDDGEFWLDEENREVHFRGAARAGYSDMGNNRKRYGQLVGLYHNYP